jgi:hypothetical protein
MVKQIVRAIEMAVAICKPRVALLKQPDAGLLSARRIRSARVLACDPIVVDAAHRHSRRPREQ